MSSIELGVCRCEHMRLSHSDRRRAFWDVMRWLVGLDFQRAYGTPWGGRCLLCRCRRFREVFA